jgi:hypothetical protein
MKHLLLSLVVVALVLPAAALGKGPTAASLDGPGGPGGITFSGYGESSGTSLGDLTQQAGFFPAVFGQQPDPMLQDRPKGDLGPRYTITYTLPGANNGTDAIRQDVYPYAKPAPVTYMEPGQEIFDTKTRGGWFQAEPVLKQTLVAAGLPSTAPAAPSSSELPTALLPLLTAVLLVVVATAIVIRRRARPAPAA